VNVGGENTTLRVARPTDDLDALLPFYRDGLGLTLLYRFEDHDGFDGMMLGREGAPYHFEFTRARGHSAGRAPTRDNLLVFYVPEKEAWRSAIERMRGAGFMPVPAFNPYWDREGVTFEDPDGYRVVFQCAAWAA
jgi:catechol 2,3-dioxygenase-like lactoylglutathione lyase family enzyme